MEAGPAPPYEPGLLSYGQRGRLPPHALTDLHEHLAQGYDPGFAWNLPKATL